MTFYRIMGDNIELRTNDGSGTLVLPGMANQPWSDLIANPGSQIIFRNNCLFVQGPFGSKTI